MMTSPYPIQTPTANFVLYNPPFPWEEFLHMIRPVTENFENMFDYTDEKLAKCAADTTRIREHATFLHNQPVCNAVRSVLLTYSQLVIGVKAFKTTRALLTQRLDALVTRLENERGPQQN
jgi:hypothetical protein